MRGDRPARWAPSAASAAAGLAALLAGLLGALVAAPGEARAQQVSFSPRPDVPEERRLARFLEEGTYTLWTRDTVLARGDTVAGDLLVLEASVRIAGRVTGDVHVVAGDLFLRPGARLGGDALVLGGGYYVSSEAVVDGEVVYRPNLLLGVLPSEGGWRIHHVRQERRAVQLDGIAGFHAPVYRRVDGWTFGWGGTVRAVELPAEPGLHGAVRFHTAGPRKWEGTVGAAVHPTGSLRVSLEGERRTATRDGWIRGDVLNSLSYLVGGDDYRNYYRSERAALRVASTAEEGLAPAAWIGWEEASSLAARPLGVLFADDGDVRPNPPVDDGEIWSVGAELSYRRRGPERRLEASLRAEAADSTAGGDASFLLGEARVRYRGPAPPTGHRVELFGITRWDLSGQLPRQRWSALGGSGTLPVLDVLSLRGPRLLYLDATYVVPLPALRVPVLGGPRVFVRNALGSAWADGEEVGLEDNVSVGVRFLFLELGVAVDVTDGDLPAEVLVGGSFPARFSD